MNEAGSQNWQGIFETQMTITLCTIVVRAKITAIVIQVLIDNRYSRVSSIQILKSFLGCGNIPRLVVLIPRRRQNQPSKASNLEILPTFPSYCGIQFLTYQSLRLPTVRYRETVKPWQTFCLHYPIRYPQQAIHKPGCQCTLNSKKLVSKQVMAFCWPKQFNSIALFKL